jgi:uncharacterized membrane protein YgaE (UPF0421/DUF939 family)
VQLRRPFSSLLKMSSLGAPGPITTGGPIIATIRVSVRAALAASLAVAIANYMRLQYPLYALIAAILVTDLSDTNRRHLGVTRFTGTVLGGAMGAAESGAIEHFPQLQSLLIGIGILGTMLLSYFLRLKEAAKVAGYVCGVVLLNHTDQPWSYGLQRVIETSLGIGAAVVVSLISNLSPFSSTD